MTMKEKHLKTSFIIYKDILINIQKTFMNIYLGFSKNKFYKKLLMTLLVFIN
jgi:hypothetical protein